MDETNLTTNERLKRRGLTHRRVGTSYRHEILDASGNVVGTMKAHETSAWLDAGCPADVKGFVEKFYEAQWMDQVAERARVHVLSGKSAADSIALGIEETTEAIRHYAIDTHAEDVKTAHKAIARVVHQEIRAEHGASPVVEMPLAERLARIGAANARIAARGEW